MARPFFSESINCELPQGRKGVPLEVDYPEEKRADHVEPTGEIVCESFPLLEACCDILLLLLQ